MDVWQQQGLFWLFALLFAGMLIVVSQRVGVGKA